MTPEDRERLRAELAHDFRGALAVIVGYGELIAIRDDDETRLEASRMILGTADRLSRAFDALLDRAVPPG